MTTQLGNNGNQLDEIMDNDGQLFNGITIDKCNEIAQANYATTDQQKRWLKNDDFWADFCYRCEELGYTLTL